MKTQKRVYIKLSVRCNPVMRLIKYCLKNKHKKSK